MTQRSFYQTDYPYFVTTKTIDGVKIFGNIKLAESLSGVIFEACKLKKAILYCYCIMPNHLHLLVKMDDVASVINNAPHYRAPFLRRDTFPRRDNPRCDNNFQRGNNLHQRLKNSTNNRRLENHTINRGLKRLTSNRGLENPLCGTKRFNNIQQFTISDLMQSIKGNFSWQLQQGKIWQSRFNYRIIYDGERLANTIEYIKNNPFKAGLGAGFSKAPYMHFNWEEIFELF